MKMPTACMLAFALLVQSTVAQAAAQRTFVASNGLDSNPCSLNQPCRTFGAAIAQTLAGGEVIVLDAAGYGIVTITKSVSIIAPPGIYAGISVFSGQTGVTINAASATVVLRGLSINGVGGSNGIHFAQGARLRVEGCVVSNLASDGIVANATGSEMHVVDTIVRDNGGAGIAVFNDSSAVLDMARVEHNGGSGISVVGAAATSTATIRRSVVSYNAQGGVAVENGPVFSAGSDVVVEDSTIANNNGDGVFVGGVHDGSASAGVRRNTIANNELSGVSVFSGGTNNVTAAIDENTFKRNGAGSVKCDGLGSFAHISRNFFVDSTAIPILLTVNGCQSATFQNNYGVQGVFSGTPPSNVQGF